MIFQHTFKPKINVNVHCRRCTTTELPVCWSTDPRTHSRSPAAAWDRRSRDRGGRERSWTDSGHLFRPSDHRPHSTTPLLSRCESECCTQSGNISFSDSQNCTLVILYVYKIIIVNAQHISSKICVRVCMRAMVVVCDILCFAHH